MPPVANALGTAPAANAPANNAPANNAPANNAPANNAPANNAPANNAPAAWHADPMFKDEHRAVFTAKGWDKLPTANEALAAVTSGYRNLEGMVKAGPVDELVRVPKEGDVEGADAFYARLGRPAKAEEYKVPDSLKDDPLAAGLRSPLHALGLTQKQFEGVLQHGGAAMELLTKQSDTDFLAKGKADDAKLRSEWGQGYDKNIAAADAVMDKLGITDAELIAMCKVSGSGEVIKRLAAAGSKLVEGATHGGEGGGGKTQLTPAEADAELKRLGKDPAWMAKLKNNDPATVAQRQELDAWALGMQPDAYRKASEEARKGLSRVTR